MTKEEIKSMPYNLHRSTFRNEQLIMNSQQCGCFHCGSIFSPEGVTDNGITTTKDEIDVEMVKFSQRLRGCIDQYGLKDIPMRMKELYDVKSELTTFNYSNLYHFE